MDEQTQRQAPHVAEGGDVLVLPGITPEQAGQHVGGAKQQQGPAWQALHCLLGDQGRGDAGFLKACVHAVRVEAGQK